MGNLHRLLTLILKSAVKAKKLAASPIAEVQTKPKPKRRPIEVLSESELAALLNHLDGGPLYYPPHYAEPRFAACVGATSISRVAPCMLLNRFRR